MIKIDENYTDYRDDTDPKFPGGKAIDAPDENSWEGTPYKADWMNDINGFRQALYTKAFGNLETITNKPDNIENSDSVNAIEYLLDKKADKKDDKKSLVFNNQAAFDTWLAANPGAIFKTGDTVYFRDEGEVSKVFDGEGGGWKPQEKVTSWQTLKGRLGLISGEFIDTPQGSPTDYVLMKDTTSGSIYCSASSGLGSIVGYAMTQDSYVLSLLGSTLGSYLSGITGHAVDLGSSSDYGQLVATSGKGLWPLSIPVASAMSGYMLHGSDNKSLKFAPLENIGTQIGSINGSQLSGTINGYLIDLPATTDFNTDDNASVVVQMGFGAPTGSLAVIPKKNLFAGVIATQQTPLIGINLTGGDLVFTGLIPLTPANVARMVSFKIADTSGNVYYGGIGNRLVGFSYDVSTPNGVKLICTSGSVIGGSYTITLNYLNS